ncbi:MAG: UDP-2,3-diacylglucosamine diphosphatase [Bacteroidales bacterium]|nr:UDP-2,3-diacylglucosamine diphosphatase [Bacteroidales bacterium]
MGNKVFFLSDAHLGSGCDSLQRERDLVTFLEGIREEARAVVLLGDIFDFWFTYKYVAPRGYTRLIGLLGLMSDSGVEIHYFIGNHDMWVFDYFEKEVGAHMYDSSARLSFCGKTLLLGHGDGLDPYDHHYNKLKRIFHNRLNQRLFATIHPRVAYGMALHWSKNSRKKHHIEIEQHYRGDENEGIYQYCLGQLRQSPFDYAVFGHRHGRIVRPLENGATYYNVGNWIERRDYAVLSDQGLELKTWTGNASNEKTEK